eukprot:g42423.t1
MTLHAGRLLLEAGRSSCNTRRPLWEDATAPDRDVTMPRWEAAVGGWEVTTPHQEAVTGGHCARPEVITGGPGIVACRKLGIAAGGWALPLVTQDKKFAMRKLTKICQNDIGQPTVAAPLTYSNRSPSELPALQTLRSSADFVIKPADKGGAGVVQRTDLYIAEAEPQLSDTSSHLPVDCDPTMEHQAIRKIEKSSTQLVTSIESPFSHSCSKLLKPHIPGVTL